MLPRRFAAVDNWEKMNQEIKDNSRSGAKEDSETASEMARIKDQLLRRISKLMRERRSHVQEVQASPRIPPNLLPRGIIRNLVVDVTLLSGDVITHLIVNFEGFVVGREVNKEKVLRDIHVSDVYAVRVRSGFLGRVGFTRWRTICD